MRYVVTEIEGYLTRTTDGPAASKAHPGLSVHVVDTAYNHRVVFTARTEDIGNQARSRRYDWRNPLVDLGPILNREERRELIREQAATRCDLLNRLDELARDEQGAIA